MAKWGTQNPPNKKGRYIVTLSASMGRQIRIADRTEYPKGNWYWYLLPGGSTADSTVTAWQKCPEPYKGDAK